MSKQLHRWTEEEKQKVVDMYLDGMEHDKIAEKMGLSQRAIDGVIRRSGVQKHPNLWTPEDDAKLVELRDEGLELKEIAERLGRSRGSVSTRSMKLGLNDRKAKEWTDEEVAKLKELFFAGTRPDDLVEQMGRSISVIWRKVTENGWKRPIPQYEHESRTWTKEEDERLKELKAQGLSRKEMAERLGKQESQIKYRIKFLGIGNPAPPFKVWTAEEEQYVTDGFKNRLSDQEMADHLGRSFGSIRSKVHDLKLTSRFPKSDLIGMRFGRLIAVKRVEDRKLPCGQVQHMWLCQCDCGKITVTSRNNLLSGICTSCGCYKDQRMKEANKRDLYNLTDYDYGIGMDSSGVYFFFDKADFEIIKDRCWKVETKENMADNHVYTRMVVGDRSKIVFMHRFIRGMSDSDYHVGDHIHGNPNDNRRCNLRLATQQVNACNRTRLASNNKSGYTGVNWSKSMNAWCAEITTNGISTKIGYYKNKEEAFEARKKAELEQRGEICYVNSDKNDGYFNPNTIDYDPSTFKTVEEAEKDYAKLTFEENIAV